MKKLLVSTILATSTFLPTFVQAEETTSKVQYTYPIEVIAKEQLIVRKGATTAYPKVLEIPAGQQVKAIDDFTNASGETWYRLDLGSVKGWVESTTITKQETSKLEKKQIQIGNAPVHKGATTSYPIVSYLKQGLEVAIIDSFTNSLGDLWYRVDLGTVKGWVPSSAFAKKALSENTQETTTEQVTESVDPVISEENTVEIDELPESEPLIETVPNGTVLYSNSVSEPIRKGASLVYTTVSTLALGQKVTVIDHFVDSYSSLWYRVEYAQGKMGWTKAEHLQQQAILNKTFYISVDVANVRSGPSLTESKVTTFRKGTVIKAIDSTLDSNGENWYKFVYENSTHAWVHHSVVTDKLVPVERLMAIGTRHAKLYKGATLQYKPVENLTYFSKVTVLQEFINASNHRWLRVKTVSGKIGWVPAWETIISTKDYQYIYALNNGSLRKGASDGYAVAGNFKAGDSLIRLWQHGDWINVETTDGKRGWIKLSDTSPTSIKKLLTPTVETLNNANFLTWKKPSGFSFPYKVLSENRLEMSGLTKIDIPESTIPGIARYEVKNVSATNQSLIIHFQPGYTFTIRNHKDNLSLKVHEVGLAGKKIYIDAGHGGKDPGAIGRSGLYEKVVVLDTANMLKAELEKAGAIVQLTRSDDIFLTLAQRTDLANLSDYDAFISLHTDSFTNRDANGTTTFYNTSLNFNSTKSITLGKTVQRHLISQLGTHDRGVKNQEFFVNKRNELPSILIELAFISNPTEEALLQTTEFRLKAAVAIKNGLEEYFSNF
ncbi:N-acetylmuramoyl-L-alanine amidase [Cytobacillus suaedae]|nr:N-acetylmuramoyl-L-alanine amidase [Cytobacillus suaedae]